VEHGIHFHVHNAPLALTLCGIVQTGFVDHAPLACSIQILVRVDASFVLQVLGLLGQEQYLAPHVNRIRFRLKATPLKVGVYVMLDFLDSVPECVQYVLQGDSKQFLVIRYVEHVKQMHGRFQAARNYVCVMLVLLDKMTGRVLCVQQEHTKQLLHLPPDVSRAL